MLRTLSSARSVIDSSSAPSEFYPLLVVFVSFVDIQRRTRRHQHRSHSALELPNGTAHITGCRLCGQGQRVVSRWLTTMGSSSRSQPHISSCRGQVRHGTSKRNAHRHVYMESAIFGITECMEYRCYASHTQLFAWQL